MNAGLRVKEGFMEGETQIWGVLDDPKANRGSGRRKAGRQGTRKRTPLVTPPPKKEA